MRGFTLLELLVSVTLIAVIVLILSLALRTGLRAWGRGQAEAEHVQAETAVDGLLDRQLLAVVRPDAEGLMSFADFSGGEDEISMVTTHGPLGAQGGGLFRAVYRFDEEGERLIYAQKVITRKEDAEEDLPDLVDPTDAEALAADGWAVSMVPGVKEVRFAYSEVLEEGTMDPDDWKDDWKDRNSPPAAVAMRFTWISPGDADESSPWRIYYIDPLAQEGAL